MSEEIRRFVAGEKITPATTLGHEASGMDHTEVRSLLGHGYRLDLVSVPEAIVLRREDGTEVSRFRVRDATRQAIEQAAHDDRHANQNV
jgi:hypothetical protein